MGNWTDVIVVHPDFNVGICRDFLERIEQGSREFGRVQGLRVQPMEEWGDDYDTAECSIYFTMKGCSDDAIRLLRNTDWSYIFHEWDGRQVMTRCDPNQFVVLCQYDGGYGWTAHTLDLVCGDKHRLNAAIGRRCNCKPIGPMVKRQDLPYD